MIGTNDDRIQCEENISTRNQQAEIIRSFCKKNQSNGKKNKLTFIYSKI